MTIAANLRAKPRLPAMAAPMFIASTADLVADYVAARVAMGISA